MNNERRKIVFADMKVGDSMEIDRVPATIQPQLRCWKYVTIKRLKINSKEVEFCDDALKYVLDCVRYIAPDPEYYKFENIHYSDMFKKMILNQRLELTPSQIRAWANKLANFKTESYFDILKRTRGLNHIKTKEIIPFWDWEFKITPSKNKHLSKKGKYVVNCIVSRIK